MCQSMVNIQSLTAEIRRGKKRKKKKQHENIMVCPVPGLFVPKTFRSQERIVPMGNFRSGDFSFLGTFVPWDSFPGNESSLGPFVLGNFRSLDLSFRGTFVPRTFRSQELSFLRLFYKTLAINADSYSNCQNLFRSRPSSVCFPKINSVSLRCVRVVFFLLNKNAK